ncbi:MAG TPA: adenine phosphoribosyltransferase [Candidatus Eisenbacteria bacterium]|nr:adenine phosphoribosyltransferase [Candidatus Eisenbacteria bacterium]
MSDMDLKAFIRDIPDFPKPGILFRDITPLLAEPRAMAEVERQFVNAWKPHRVTAVAAVESRGFIFGTLVARALGIPFIPIRKQGKLPWTRLSESYALEYGEGVLEAHEDAARAGDRVVIIDDLLATGGTAAASARLIERLGAHVAGFGFVVELEVLQGRKHLGDRPVISLLRYD